MPKINWSSKTLLACLATFLSAAAGFIGVQLSQSDITIVSTALTGIGQYGTLIFPIVAGVFHQIMANRSHAGLVKAGVTHEEATAITKS